MPPKGLPQLHAELREAERNFEEAEAIYEMYARDMLKADPLEIPVMRESQSAAYSRMLEYHRQVGMLQAEIRTQDRSYTRDYFVERMLEDRETARDTEREAKQAQQEREHAPQIAGDGRPPPDDPKRPTAPVQTVKVEERERDTPERPLTVYERLKEARDTPEREPERPTEPERERDRDDMRDDWREEPER